MIDWVYEKIKGITIKSQSGKRLEYMKKMRMRNKGREKRLEEKTKLFNNISKVFSQINSLSTISKSKSKSLHKKKSWLKYNI